MQPTGLTLCPKCGADLASPGAACANCLLELGFATYVGNEAEPASETTSAARVFGDYELLDEIARGGMGVVYRARQRRLGRTVALKLILGGQLATREFVHRFRAEAAAAAALQHPNIVAIHDVGVHDGNHFFSMDYVEGQNLAQLVGNQPLPAQKAARYLKLIAEAIHYAHEQGILHRDLKPSNVLVDAGTDQPRVTDFGLAKSLNGESSLTLTGQVLGSPHFMPPEQADARRGKVGRRSDVYGLGGILYFLLTARAPFQGDSLETTIGQVLNAEPVPPRLLNPTVPRDLETICLKCLSKEPDRRYPTALALGEDLSRFLNAESILARPTTILERTWRWCRRKPAFAGLVAAAAVLLLTLAIGSPIVALRIQHARQIAQSEQQRADAQARKASESEQQARRSLYAADMNLATQAWYLGNFKAARDLLAKHGPHSHSKDLIGIEWRLLWTLCHKTDEAFAFGTYSGQVRSVAPSPDARIAACAIDDGTVRILNVYDRNELVSLKQASGIVNSVAFSPDGRLLATAGSDRYVHVVDTRDWHESDKFGPLESEISHVSFSPDGRIIAAGSGQTIILWDLASRARRTIGDDHYVERFAFSPDGRTLASFGGLCTLVRFWDAISGERLGPLEAHTAIILGIAFSPDGQFFASSGHDNKVKLWSRDEQNAAWKHRATFLHEALVRALSFSPDSRLLATGGGDNMVKIWDVNLEESIRTWRGHSGAVNSIAFIADGALISGSADGSVRLWDPPSGPERNRLAQTGIIANMSLSSDGKTLITSDPNHSVVHLWDIPSQTRIHSFTGKSGFAANVALSPDGKFVAIHRKDDVFQLWALPDFQTPLLTLEGQQVFVGHNVAFSPDSQTVVFPSSRHTVTLCNVTANQRLGELDLTPPVVFKTAHGRFAHLGLAFSPGGDRIAIVAAGQVTIWNVKTRTNVQKIGPVGLEIRSVAFSPDGNLLALPTEETAIGVWDLGKNEKLASFDGHTAFVDTVAFSPDGKTLASCSYDGAIKLWSLEIKQNVATLRGHLGPVTALLFSADGSAFYSASGDATVKLWPITAFAEMGTKSE